MGAKKNTTVIAVGMQKGGVAKTTNALHLAAALGEKGRRCLLWDVDENHGATNMLRIPPEAFSTTYHVLTGDTLADEAVLPFDDDDVDIELPHNVDMIPGSRSLAEIDHALAQRDPFYNANECLREPTAQLRELGRWDYIIIDTGPSASPTTRSSYLVSDFFILSLIPEKPAVDGLRDALRDISAAKKPNRNPRLQLLGLILSCMDVRVTLARRYEQLINETFKRANEQPVKFKTTIGRAAAIGRATDIGKTILQTEPDHKVSQQFRDLAEEVEQRVQAFRVSGPMEAANG